MESGRETGKSSRRSRVTRKRHRPCQTIKFGTNIDLADRNKFRCVFHFLAGMSGWGKSGAI